jgi:hypothetical protein
VAAVIVLAACGSGTGTSSPTGTPTAPVATATPEPPHPLEFAILLLASSQNSTGTDHLTILDPSGSTHGQVAFEAPAQPMVGNAATVTQQPAITAAGAAYYADSHGNINVLRPDSNSVHSVVAGLPFTGQQQELSFVVSPTGQMVMAMVMQLPQLQTNCNGPCGFQPGAIHLKVLSATAGAAATTLTQRDIAQDQFGNAPRMFAWNAAGPVSLDDAATGTQDGIPGYAYAPWGHAHYLMSNGQAGQVVGGSGCALDDLAADGTAVCDPAQASAAGAGPLKVVRSSGSPGYNATPEPVSCAGCQVQQVAYIRLSPDGSRVAVAVVQAPSNSNTSTVKAELIDSAGSITPLADNFQPEGWLDSQTLIGTTDSTLGATGGQTQTTCPNGDIPGNYALSLIRLSDATHVLPLNQCGTFVGVVRPAS